MAVELEERQVDEEKADQRRKAAAYAVSAPASAGMAPEEAPAPAVRSPHRAE